MLISCPVNLTVMGLLPVYKIWTMNIVMKLIGLVQLHEPMGHYDSYFSLFCTGLVELGLSPVQILYTGSKPITVR